MVDPPPEFEHEPEPVLPGNGDGVRRHLGLAVALTLISAVLVFGTIQVVGRLTAGGPGATPSDRAGASSGSAATPGSSGPAASPIASSAASSAPSGPTSPGLIAVVDDNGKLTTMDDGGGSAVLYPAPGVVFGFPAWSPDGTRIAAVGTSENDIAVYVFTVPNAGAARTHGPPNTRQIDGPAPVVIYRSAERPPFYLYWTPDGRQLGFLVSEPVGLSLRVAPADGSAPVDGSGSASIVRTGEPFYFDWLDPERLLVHIDFGAKAFTGEVGLDGKSVAPALKGNGLFRSPSHSSDGRYLAYVRVEADGTEQLVVAGRGRWPGHEMPVFGPAAFVFDPTGHTLAIIGAEAQSEPDAAIPLGPLRLIDLDTRAVRTLLEGPVAAFFWSPDGKTIAAILPSEPGDEQVTAGTGAVLAGAVAPRPSSDPGAQATGVTARLAFVDVTTGFVSAHRVVQLAEHFVNQLLPYFDQYALSHRLWSPDSASILLPLVDPSGYNQEVVVPADGEPPRPVAGGAKGFWSP